MNQRQDRHRMYDMLTEQLKSLEQSAPHLAPFEAVGQRHRGRQASAMTLNNLAADSWDGRLAFYVDVNNWGEEVIRLAVALHTIDYGLANTGNGVAHSLHASTRGRGSASVVRERRPRTPHVQFALSNRRHRAVTD